MASGTLKLSLTGHISSVRGVAVSPRQPYLFSCGEDKKVMCWDLEQNKVGPNWGHKILKTDTCLKKSFSFVFCKKISIFTRPTSSLVWHPTFFLKNLDRKKNVMDKIWDTNPLKSEVISCCGGDEETNDHAETIKIER